MGRVRNTKLAVIKVSFLVNFEQIKHFYCQLILLTLNMFSPATSPLKPYTSNDNF